MSSIPSMSPMSSSTSSTWSESPKKGDRSLPAASSLPQLPPSEPSLASAPPSIPSQPSERSSRASAPPPTPSQLLERSLRTSAPPSIPSQPSERSSRASALASTLSSQISALTAPVERPVSYVRRATRAAAYPLRGVWYFSRHRELWPLMASRLLPLCIISGLVYFLLFTFAFLPQFALLAIFHGWGAWLNAVVLVLGEGLVIIQALFEGFFVDECRVDCFDATLINYGLEDLVAPHRILHPDARDSVRRLGKPTSPAIYQPWSLTQMVELVLCLPLNLIPYIGTPAFIMITGARLGKLSHYRWYQLRGLTRKQRKQEIRIRAWDYTWFGTVAMLMELVPVLSLFFLLTTTAGAAMWVAKLEERKRAANAVVNGGDPSGREPYREPYRDEV